MGGVRLLVLSLIPLAAGCAARQASTRPAEVVELRRQVDALRRQTERDQKAIHALENRVFVCEDRLTAAEDPDARRLPVVRKRPGGGTPVASEPELSDDDRPIRVAQGWEEEGDVEIVYEGEAAKETRPRRVIRIHETEDDPFAGDAPDIDPATVDERLPVVPLPDERPRPAVEPLAAYKAAYALLEEGDHAGAIAGFQKVIDTWPSHDYADNAQYWLAEAYYAQGNYKTALAEFRKVAKRWPDGNKAPDAQLKVGFCHQKLADLDAAREALTQLIQTYPKSDAARLARKRLEEMGK